MGAMSGKILLADDTESIRQLLKRFLLPLASSFIEVGSGAELLEVAPIEKPDLILLDINMPGSDVLDNLSFLRAEPVLLDTSIILISGSDDPEILDQAFKAGADDFLLKPPNFRQLKSRVSAYLAKSELKRLRAYCQALAAISEAELEALGLPQDFADIFSRSPR